jgi:hypothetical protein
VGTITRVSASLKFGACAMPALWPRRADDLNSGVWAPVGRNNSTDEVRRATAKVVGRGRVHGGAIQVDCGTLCGVMRSLFDS